jgi:hypothetical protein
MIAPSFGLFPNMGKKASIIGAYKKMCLMQSRIRLNGKLLKKGATI